MPLFYHTVTASCRHCSTRATVLLGVPQHGYYGPARLVTTFTRCPSRSTHYLPQGPTLHSCGKQLDTRSDAFGQLRRSDDVLPAPQALPDAVSALRQRLQEDGYLYLPGYLDRALVLEARAEVTQRLAAEGFLDPSHPVIDSVASPDCKLKFKPDLAKHNAPLMQLLYAGRMMEFFRRPPGRRCPALRLHVDARRRSRPSAPAPTATSSSWAAAPPTSTPPGLPSAMSPSSKAAS